MQEKLPVPFQLKPGVTRMLEPDGKNVLRLRLELPFEYAPSRAEAP
jgi:hypothetical protein